MARSPILCVCALAIFEAASAALIPQQPLAPAGLLPAPVTSTNKPSPLPLVVWHGLGDKYAPTSPKLTSPLTIPSYKADGLRSIATLANTTNPGTYTYFIRLDDSPSSDRTATFLGNLTEQISQVCADISSHPILSKAPAINALGFSQGGQFMRAYVERCNIPRVASLVTFGSQHNGISEFQKCGDNDWVCRGWDGYLKSNTWTEFVQSRLVPAQYFRDPEDLESYLENSNFLADVNNEREVKNATYKENMKKLDRFAMYIFKDDKTVVPKESAYFSEVNTTSEKVTGLRDRKMYVEDWIGLRWLDEEKKLEFREVDGEHMQLTEEVLVDAFQRYFGPKE